MSTVTMINSVGENAAGSEIELPDEIADLFILRGYADGTLSRDYDPNERAEILGEQQVVGLGG
jgi:hypothetical protein